MFLTLCVSNASLNINLLSVYDIQSLLQRTESLAFEVVDIASYLFRIPSHFHNPRRLCFEFACECLLAVLNGDGVAAFRIGRDVDVQAYDVACVDILFIYGFARFVSNAYLIGIAEWVEIDR